MAAGAIVLASPPGGVTEAISDGCTGYLLSAEESEQWVDRVTYLQNNPKTVLAVQKAARKWTEDEKSNLELISRKT